MLTIIPELLWLVVEDHDACCDERGCLLDNVIGIGHSPWLTLKAWRGSRRAWGAWRAWRARWKIWVSTRGSWWAGRIIQKATWWTQWSRWTVWGTVWWTVQRAAWWTGRS